MNPFSAKSNENRQKTPELHAEDREAVNDRWPVRHTAYTDLYTVVQKSFPAAFEQPAQPTPSIGGYAVKNYDNRPAEVAHLQPASEQAPTLDIAELSRRANELATPGEMSNA